MRLITVSITPALPTLTTEEVTRVVARTGVPVEHVYAGSRDGSSLVGVYTSSAGGGDIGDQVSSVISALEGVAGLDRAVRAEEHGWPGPTRAADEDRP